MHTKTISKEHAEYAKHGKLIKSVLVSHKSVYPGQTVSVSVKSCLREGLPFVTINGVPGPVQYLQFSGPPGGTRTLAIEARCKRRCCSERKTVSVEVREPSRCHVYPIIAASSNFAREAAATFRISNWAQVDEPGARYVWDFGAAGSQTVKGDAAAANVSFEDHLDPNAPYTTFHTNVRVHYTDGITASGTKSIVVWNTYAIGKRRGLVSPKVTYDPRASRESNRYAAKCLLKNVEAEPLQFTQSLVEFLLDDSEGHNKFATAVGISVTVPPRSEKEFDCSVPTPLPKNTLGFALHFSGKLQSGLPAQFSCYFESRDAQPFRIITDPRTVQVLHDMRNDIVNKGKSSFSRTDIETKIRQNLKMDGKALQPIKTFLDKDFEVVLPGTDVTTRGLTDDEFVGKECIPDEEPPADGLACQLTEEWAWVTYPARVINAKKGDTVLSPGGNGVIGGLLKNLSPPQVYAHCGIMTKNYTEIRHSTGTDEYLEDHLRGSFLGNPGTDGLDPDVLTYGWPGTITQTIANAYNGEWLEDPGKAKDDKGNIKYWRIAAFDWHTEQHGTDGNLFIVDPLVLSIDPVLEASRPELRETLQKAADAAKNIIGHYRLFCYSEASISSGRTIYNAPDRGPQWWASSTRPTVCSSFIWAAMKAVESPKINLEGDGNITQPADLEPRDTAAGAATDKWTRDGLYAYDAQERLACASWLYDTIHEVNTFAFDWAGANASGDQSKDSDQWKSPGRGHAVSPDNQLNWDPPTEIVNGVQHGIYGYTQKMIYRPETYEYRKVSRWVRVQRKGTITGSVLYNSNPVAGANVNVAGKAIVTSASGQFFTEAPVGPYHVTAGKLISGYYMQGAVEATVVAYQTTTVSLTLADPPDFDREVVFQGTIKILDSDFCEFHAHSSPSLQTNQRFDLGSDNPSPVFALFRNGIFVGPYGTHAEHTFVQRWADEIRVELRLVVDWVFPGDVNIAWNCKLFEGDSDDTTDVDEETSGFLQAKKGQGPNLKIHIVNRGAGGGDYADISLTCDNRRRP